MNRATLTEERLEELLQRFAYCRLAVLGDFFLDTYLEVDARLVETSVETGKPAHQVVDVRCSPGAAGTVVNNLAALGSGQMHAVGVTGDDGAALELRRGLEAVGCGTDYLIASNEIHTPSYLKPRDVSVAGLAGEHSRYDTKNRQPLSTSLQCQLIHSLPALLTDVEAVIVLDQLEPPEFGVVSAPVREAVIALAQRYREVVFWADSRCCTQQFQHVIIKCNEYEVVGVRQPQPGTEVADSRLWEAAARLRIHNAAPVVVTRGARGAWASDPMWTLAAGVQVPGDVDTTGAGDSFTAGTVLALCAGASLGEAALVGNLVASLTIQQLGDTGVTSQDEVMARWRVWHEQQASC